MRKLIFLTMAIVCTAACASGNKMNHGQKTEDKSPEEIIFEMARDSSVTVKDLVEKFIPYSRQLLADARDTSSLVARLRAQAIAYALLTDIPNMFLGIRFHQMADHSDEILDFYDRNDLNELLENLSAVLCQWQFYDDPDDRRISYEMYFETVDEEGNLSGLMDSYFEFTINFPMVQCRLDLGDEDEPMAVMMRQDFLNVMLEHSALYLGYRKEGQSAPDYERQDDYHARMSLYFFQKRFWEEFLMPGSSFLEESAPY